MAISVPRVKQFHARSAAYDQILKKNEQIYALLAITVSLCPAAIRVLDEFVLLSLREKYAFYSQTSAVYFPCFLLPAGEARLCLASMLRALRCMHA